MGTLRFVLRTDKPTKNGLCRIQGIFQLHGKRQYFNTDKKILKENWDADKQMAKLCLGAAGRSAKNEKIMAGRLGYSEGVAAVEQNKLSGAKELLLEPRKVDKLNQYLAEIRSDIERTESALIDLKGRNGYSANDVISKYRRKPKEVAPAKEIKNQSSVISFIGRYIADHADSRERGSLQVYRSLKMHLEGYASDNGAKLSFSDINYPFFQSFQNYLNRLKKKVDGKFVYKLNSVTVAKQLSTLKTFLNYARLHNIPVSDDFKKFVIKKQKLEVIALSNEEFEKLYYAEIDNNRLRNARDIFCFSCATGLRYSDMKNLKRENIKGDELRIFVKKTKEPLTIPLNPFSHAILERFKEMHNPLPVSTDGRLISNAKLNKYIKELCRLVEINEPIEIVRYRGTKRESTTYPKHELVTVHTGRKTFCTLSLEKGASAEEVMSWSGHEDYASFKRYVKITEQRKKIVMRNTWGEVKLIPLKVVKTG